MGKGVLMVCVAGLVTGLAACSGMDYQSRHRSQQEQWHPASAILIKYADKNGVVTRAAMEAGLKVDFDRIDLNHDGCLNEDEVRAENERRWQIDASTYSPLIDFKHTGCVDFEEYAETARSLFDQLDRKGDGKLTPQELTPGATNPGSPSTTEVGGRSHHPGGGNPNGSGPGGQ
jgi:hypothetical protein